VISNLFRVIIYAGKKWNIHCQILVVVNKISKIWLLYIIYTLRITMNISPNSDNGYFYFKPLCGEPHTVLLLLSEQLCTFSVKVIENMTIVCTRVCMPWGSNVTIYERPRSPKLLSSYSHFVMLGSFHDN